MAHRRPRPTRLSTIHLGTWSILCDIAGQVSRAPNNPIVTVAAVGIASDVAPEVRRRLIRCFKGHPVKWKVAAAGGFRHVAALAAAFQFRIAVAQIHMAGNAWDHFYEDAVKFHDEAKDKTGKPLRYLAGDEVMRMLLFGEGFANLVGRLLRARHPWGDVPATIDLKLIVDSDLRSDETREQFRWALEEWAKTSTLHAQLDVAPTVSARASTEQAEPLLLFPDYIAGVYHHADPRARLAQPVISPDAASELVHLFRARMAGKLFEVPKDFAEEYPLEHRDGRLIRRGEA
jgi:hypothetical protein